MEVRGAFASHNPGSWIIMKADVWEFMEQQERHSYEKCQYEEFKKRVVKMDELREAKGGARSN